MRWRTKVLIALCSARLETDRICHAWPGSHTLRRRPSKLVEEASALALVGAREVGIKTVVRFASHTDEVLVEKVQVQQVLLNLMRNAIDVMQGCDRKELLVTTSEPNGNEITVSVADTGNGLSEEIAGRLFQPFVTTKPAGMGVGLSISRRIVEAHGGEMWAEANLSGGMVFRFTLQSATEATAIDA